MNKPLNTVKLAVALLLIAGVMGGGAVVAQVWDQPPGSPPSSNTGPYIYLGDKVLSTTTPGIYGGGEAQARTGDLRIGSTAAPTAKLDVTGLERVLRTFVVGDKSAPAKGMLTAMGTVYGVHAQTHSSGNSAVTGVAIGSLPLAKGVRGDASGSNGRGVFGQASVAGATGVKGEGYTNDSTSYAGYFYGAVNVINPNGQLIVGGNATFNSTVTALGGAVSVGGSVIVDGVNLMQINAASLQNFAASTPTTAPGIKFFTVETSSVPPDGVATFTPAQTGYHMGVCSNDPSRACNSGSDCKSPGTCNPPGDSILRLTAMYNDSADLQADWKRFTPPFDTQLAYRQCTTDTQWLAAGALPGSDTAMSLLAARDGTIYVGVQGAGGTGQARIYKSTNRGITWVDTGLPNDGATGVWDMIESRDGSVYAATGNTGDIYKYTYNGTVWSWANIGPHVAGAFMALLEETSFCSNNPNRVCKNNSDCQDGGTCPAGTIFAGFSSGSNNVYRRQTTQTGIDWSPLTVTGGVNSAVESLLQTSDGNLYAGTANAGKIYVSQDHGQVWSPVPGTLTGQNQVPTLIQSQNGYLFAGGSLNGGGLSGHVWYSTNMGVTWTSTGPTVDEVKKLYQTSGGHFYAATGNIGQVYESPDGLAWTAVGSLSGTDSSGIFEDNAGIVYVTVGTSVMRTSSPGYLPGTAGSIAIKNTTGVKADFRLMGTYMPGAAVCP